jgi:ABC-type uncharacterized transport system auxiliary subunit
MRSLAAVWFALSFVACSSVELPRERFWRLDVSSPAGGQLPQGGVLRVADLQLANALQGDCLLLTTGSAEMTPLERDRWIAPLDRLVTDAVVLGLSRSRMFALVKGAGDPGREDWSLHGRVVDFGIHQDREGRHGHVTFQFWVDQRDVLVLQDEFTARVPVADASAAAGVDALSSALQQVLDQLTGRMRSARILDRSIDSAPAK